MWDLPGPGIEPVSPALAGGFLTTAPPGKSLLVSYKAHSLGENLQGIMIIQNTLNTVNYTESH